MPAITPKFGSLTISTGNPPIGRDITFTPTGPGSIRVNDMDGTKPAVSTVIEGSRVADLMSAIRSYAKAPATMSPNARPVGFGEAMSAVNLLWNGKPLYYSAPVNELDSRARSLIDAALAVSPSHGS